MADKTEEQIIKEGGSRIIDAIANQDVPTKISTLLFVLSFFLDQHGADTVVASMGDYTISAIKNPPAPKLTVVPDTNTIH